MSDKKLIREWYPLEYDAGLITEAKKSGGKITLKGIIQKADTKNQNGRVYPRAVLEREMENYQKAIRERRGFGELDHPERSTVNLSEVSHLVVKAWWEGSNVMGEIEVLSTPKGKILAELLSAGAPPGISSRGLGNTRPTTFSDGTNADEVMDDYQIICFDIVSEPSTPGAYLHEGKNLDFDPKKTWSKADRIWRALNEITRK